MWLHVELNCSPHVTNYEFWIILTHGRRLITGSCDANRNFQPNDQSLTKPIATRWPHRHGRPRHRTYYRRDALHCGCTRPQFAGGGIITTSAAGTNTILGTDCIALCQSLDLSLLDKHWSESLYTLDKDNSILNQI